MSVRRLLKSIAWKLMPFADISFTANTGISFPMTTKMERDMIKELFLNKEYETLFSRLNNNCYVIEGLVGKRNSVKEFHISKQLGRSSSVTRHEVQKTVSVKTIDLYGIANELQFKKFDLIKTDIEGAEGEFVSEYSDLISSAMYLLLEWHAICGLTWEEFVKKMNVLEFSHIRTSSENEGAKTALFEKIQH